MLLLLLLLLCTLATVLALSSENTASEAKAGVRDRLRGSPDAVSPRYLPSSSSSTPELSPALLSRALPLPNLSLPLPLLLLLLRSAAVSLLLFRSRSYRSRSIGSLARSVV